jgi:hypothetical protein
MKYKILATFILFLANLGFTQSKKEQIQLLNARLDSLKSIQSIDKQTYNEIINELELSINLKIKKISEFSISLAIDKTKLTNNIELNKQLDNEILSLRSQLKSFKDSLQEIINKQAIKLLDNSSIKKSDKELIQLMNVHDEDLGEEFVNQNDPEIKPIYEIIGKQLFELKGKLFCLVVLGVSNPNDYHVSSGTNFIACFKIKEDQWTLLNPAMNTSFNPSFEFGIPAWIDKFVLFGDQSLAIILEGGYSGMGHSSGKRTIYGLNNLNQISLIYEGISGEDDQGNEGSSEFRNVDDTFEINFQKISKANHYDLVEIKKSHGKKVKTRTYKFNESTFKYE